MYSARRSLIRLASDSCDDMVGESPGSEKAPGICASSEEAVVLVDPKVLVVVLRLRDIVVWGGVHTTKLCLLAHDHEA